MSWDSSVAAPSRAARTDVRLSFGGRIFPVREHETVLECLERHGMPLPSSCRSGVCMSCMIKAVSGDVPPAASVGLKSAWKRDGYLLACLCRPESDLELDVCESVRSFDTQILRARPFSRDVCGIWLRKPAGFAFDAGQFVRLTRPEDGLARPYSIASLPDADEIELHVRAVREGRMSGWLSRAEGAAIRLSGPFGECRYEPQEGERPLLLVGTGTGLAPLLGVLRAALAAKHRGPIHLFHGAREIEGHYFAPWLRDLEAEHPQLRVTLSVTGLAGSVGQGSPYARRLDEVVFEKYPDVRDFRVYVCGNPETVRNLKKKAYLAGAPLQRIHADPFVHAPLAAAALPV